MGKVTGFLEVERRDRDYEPPSARLRTWREFVNPLPDADLTTAGVALHELRHSILS